MEIERAGRPGPNVWPALLGLLRKAGGVAGGRGEQTAGAEGGKYDLSGAGMVGKYEVTV